MRYKKYTLDFTNVKYFLEVHYIIKTSLDFPDYYGCNWDAFWDMLSWECPASKVTIIGANTLPKSWKALDGKTYPEKIRKILQRNKEAREKYNYEFDYEFTDA